MLEGIFNPNLDPIIRSILGNLTNDHNTNLARSCPSIRDCLAIPAHGNAGSTEAIAVAWDNAAAAAAIPPAVIPGGPLPVPPIAPVPPPAAAIVALPVPGPPLAVGQGGVGNPAPMIPNAAPLIAQPPPAPPPVAGAMPPIIPTEALRYQADLIDKCDEDRLPCPPAIAPLGTCPNRGGTQHRVKACRHSRYFIASQRINPYHTVCTGCRNIWHFSRITAQRNTTQHSMWRQRISEAHAPVCRLCETEQRDDHPEGLDACACYTTLYQERWLCSLCGNGNVTRVSLKILRLSRRRSRLRRVGNTMVLQPRPLNLPGQNPLCACERAPVQALLPWPAVPPRFHIPHVFPGNHMIRYRGNPVMYPRHVRQCLVCCGFIVRPSPVRRSLRVRDRRLKFSGREHIMIGDKRRQTRRFTNRWAD